MDEFERALSRVKTQAAKFKSKGAKELLRTHAALSLALREKGITRSANNPVADYAEGLGCAALGLELASASTPGYDGRAADRKYKRGFGVMSE